MGLSQEIRFKIGGDNSGLRASFAQAATIAEQSGKRMEAALSKIDKIKNSRGLIDFRRRVAFEEADTVGKIRITTEKLAALSGRLATTEAGTTKQKRLQLEMDKERYKLTLLRQQKLRENLNTETAQPPAEDQGAAGNGIRTNIAKYAFRLVGGTVIGALRAALDYQNSRREIAQSQEESRAIGLASTRSRFAATGGVQAQLTQGQGTMRDLESQKDFVQQRINFLRTPAQMALMALDRFGAGFKLLNDAEKEVERLNAELQKQHDINALLEKDLVRQRDIRKTEFGFGGRIEGNTIKINSKPSGSIAETGEAASRGQLNDVRKELIELRRLRGVQAAEIKYGGASSDVAQNARIAVEAQKVNLQRAQQAMRARLLETNRELSGEAVEGRTFSNGRPRPLSETERLARRAQMFRQRARDAVLTGAAGDVGHFTRSAIGDEASVANRLGRASSQAQKLDVADATSIKPELTTANQLLTAIKDSLKPQDVN
ncbi:MAG TPA: hypothetical protein VHN11_21145 [Xanthobacteraceae bacterium]|jgi:hypothetical protein|nr:hypothetical protein [Xanthobacteraceae bacterium]